MAATSHSFGPMDGDQSHGVLTGEVGGVELLGGLLLHSIQIGEKGLQ